MNSKEAISINGISSTHKDNHTVMEKTMDARGLENIPALNWAVVFILSAWGGTVQFVRRVKKNKGVGFTIAELVGEITISSFAGIVVFLLCESRGIDRTFSAALCAVSGSMGSRILYQIEIWATKKVLGSYTDSEK